MLKFNTNVTVGRKQVLIKRSNSFLKGEEVKESDLEKKCVAQLLKEGLVEEIKEDVPAPKKVVKKKSKKLDLPDM